MEQLTDMGDVSGELRTRVMDQKDLEVLSRWHKLAARSRTVAEFENAVLKEQ